MNVKAKGIKKETEVPEKDIVQEETAQPSASEQKQVTLSKEESHIAELVREQPKDVASIKLKTLSRFNLLELPEECKPFSRTKFRYKWLSKQNLEIKLNSDIWTLCTRSNSSYIKPHRFKDHGAVEQSGMLLAFAPEDVGQERAARPAKKSAALVKHYTEDLPKDEGRGFYTPENTGEDEDSEGLTEGKDF